jgi:hypothetical protein
MTDEHAHLDEALENVIIAARAHLAAVKTADGRVDDDGVWKAYVDLNNASFTYDDALLDAYGEVTPWDVDAIDPDLAEQKIGDMADLVTADDPYPQVISVRQRRDYRIPSVAGLLKAAQSARFDAMKGDEGAEEPVESVGEAVLELLQSGDGSLAALDLPELEPLDGLVAVAEVDSPLDLTAFDDVDGAGPFTLAAPDRLIGRLDEQPYMDLDEGDDD